MKRRDFLKSSSAVSLPILLNGFGLGVLPQMAALSGLEGTDKILILIQLNGGNDGLNTVIPLASYDNLAGYRGNILIPENQILQIDENVGFHPAMMDMFNMYQDGKIHVVEGVAYPNQNRSHFRSTDIWSTGSAANEFLTTGWMGRYFQNIAPDFPDNYPNNEYPDPFALTIGSLVSETCQGVTTNFSLALNDPAALAPLTEAEIGELPNTNYGAELAYLIDAIAQTNAYSEVILAAADAGTNMSELYSDDNRLAQQLRTVALLIAGGLKTNVYVVSLGGFDTHANQTPQGNPANGIHAGLLSTLSDAVNAFQDDLQLMGLDERVLGMTFSEFGRQIRSNDSQGTDHGTAAPVILFGSCVKSGFTGEHPDIGSEVAFQEGVAMQYDFRSVYATVLMDWFGSSAEEVKDILFDGVQHLDILQICDPSTSTEEILEDLVELNLYPNPCENIANLEFSTSQRDLRISLFDHLGQELKVISNRSFPEGFHNLKIETHHLVPGNYFVRLQSGNGQKTRKLIKI